MKNNILQVFFNYSSCTYLYSCHTIHRIILIRFLSIFVTTQYDSKLFPLARVRDFITILLLISPSSQKQSLFIIFYFYERSIENWKISYLNYIPIMIIIFFLLLHISITMVYRVLQIYLLIVIYPWKNTIFKCVFLFTSLVILWTILSYIRNAY